MGSISIIRIALACVVGAFASSCSSVFYYPTHVQHVPPERVQLVAEDVWFSERKTDPASPDPKKLHGWYFSSETSLKDESLRRKTRAVIAFFHGNAENITSHYLSLHWILPFGYDFFIFDYEGYGLSEGKATPESTVRSGVTALRYAAQRAEKLGVPLLVFGQSLGGAVALRSVAEVKDELPIRFVAVESSFYSYKEVARQLLNSVWITWPFQWVSYLLLSDKWAPEGQIPDLAPIPLLVIHGDQDRTVKFPLGEGIFDRARSPREIWRVPGGGHINAFWRPGFEYRKKFLQKLDFVISSSE